MRHLNYFYSITKIILLRLHSPTAPHLLILPSHRQHHPQAQGEQTEDARGRQRTQSPKRVLYATRK